MRKGPVFLSVTSSANLAALDATNRKLREVGRSAKTTSAGFGGFGKGLAKIASTSALIGIGVKAIKEATEAFKTTAMTEQLLKNTGLAASVSAKQIGDLSMQISNLTGIDDEQVQAASNVLLGFKGLVPAGAQAQSTLANLTQVATDLGVKMGKDPAAAAKVLGKALMDPAKGVAALYRAGIPLDAQLSERIKNMAKAGQVEQARALILQNVASSTKGLAAATADPMQRLQTMLNNLLETVGTPILNAIGPILTALQPVFEALTPILTELGTVIGDVITSLATGLTPLFPVLMAVIKPLLPVVVSLGKLLGAFLPILTVLTPLLSLLAKLLAGAVTIAIKGVTFVLYGLVKGIGFMVKALSNIPVIGEKFKPAVKVLDDVAASLKDVAEQVGRTDTAQKISDVAIDYKGAAAALKAGASDAGAAAKAVGASMGRKTAKVKPKTAVRPDDSNYW
jgi:phage-related protein